VIRGKFMAAAHQENMRKVTKRVRRRLRTLRDLKKALARNVSELRKRQKLSQMEISRRSGISQSRLSRLEEGEYWPKPEKLVALADAFDVEVEDLLGPQPPALSPKPKLSKAAVFRIINTLIEEGVVEVDIEDEKPKPKKKLKPRKDSDPE
jgi:transcriptional regulator with XRE-family HTH domain